jgi:hypothetical protein
MEHAPANQTFEALCENPVPVVSAIETNSGKVQVLLVLRVSAVERYRTQLACHRYSCRH